MRCRKILFPTHFAIAGLPRSLMQRTGVGNGKRRWRRGEEGSCREREAGREDTVLCPWGRSSQPRGSSRCVLREVFGDLAKPGQDGRWQEAPEHLFVSWLRICHISLNRYPVFKALAGKFPALQKPHRFAVFLVVS